MTSILTAAQDPAVQRAVADFEARLRRRRQRGLLRLVATLMAAVMAGLIWGAL